MTKDPNKKQTADLANDLNLEEQIRQRAHALYEERGREHGHDLDDWFRAEAELRTTGLKAAA
jgi:hypothetical protein